VTPAGIILAAGASVRMGQPKALLPFGGVTFLDRAIALLAPLCDPLILVLGYHRGEIESSLAGRPGICIAVNPHPARGMLSSLQCGLAAAPLTDSGVMFTVVDCPAVRPETARAVLDAFLQRRPAVAVPVFNGKRGHPVCISLAVARDLLAAPANEPAREIIARHRTPDSLIGVNDPGAVTDADFPQDLATLDSLAL
jgi:molybdenum cofactor cytidylyltransferase